MTTFVPLASDAEGAASAVAVGDWLLQILTKHEKNPTQKYYDTFIALFSHSESKNEQRVVDFHGLILLLLEQHSIVFDYLYEVKQNTEAASADREKAAEIKKSYADVAREVEEFFSLIMSMIVLRINDVQVQGQIAGQLCTIFRSSKELPEFRLKLLQTLYNAFPVTFPYRFSIFGSALEYAAETNLFHLMLPSIKYLNEWMKDWSLTPTAKRQVFFILATELKKMKRIEDAYYYLKRHLQYFQGEKDEVLANPQTIETAVELAVDSINLNEVLHLDGVIELDAIKYLSNTKYKDLVKLIEIFKKDGAKELTELYQQNPELFEEHGLNYEKCLQKIRLLSVSSLACKRKELKINKISEYLKLSDEEAEEVIVQAIGQGLIDAKIDQITKVIYIKSSMQREFGKLQWEEVYERLDYWIDAVDTLLKVIKKVKEQNASSAFSLIPPATYTGYQSPMGTTSSGAGAAVGGGGNGSTTNSSSFQDRQFQNEKTQPTALA